MNQEVFQCFQPFSNWHYE